MRKPRPPAVLLAVLAVNCGHPHDDALINHFHNNRAQYERVRDMLFEDTQLRCVTNREYTLVSGEEYNEPSEVLPDSRWKEYSELLGRIDAKRVCNFGQFNASGRAIHFFLSYRGTVFRGSRIGIAFDDRESPDYHGGRSGDTELRQIEGNWYIFEDQD